MTHDELLAKIKDLEEDASSDVWLIHSDRCCGNCTCDKEEQRVTSIHKALRTVVELHEPMDNYAGNVCGYCFSLNYEPTGLEMDYELYSYPCTTIKIIEKELT